MSVPFKAIMFSARLSSWCKEITYSDQWDLIQKNNKIPLFESLYVFKYYYYDCEGGLGQLRDDGGGCTIMRERQEGVKSLAGVYVYD